MCNCWLLIHFIRRINAKNMEHIKMFQYICNCSLLFTFGNYKPDGTLNCMKKKYPAVLCVIFFLEYFTVPDKDIQKKIKHSATS
jgi:hypothetical protein